MYGEEGSGITVTVDTLTASPLEFTVTDLMPDTNYHLRVAARNSQGAGAYSDAVMATTLAIPGK